jgi:hypothetical protein
VTDFLPIYRTHLKRYPRCGYKDNCSITRDERILICARVSSERPARDGRWTHFLEDPPNSPAPRVIKHSPAPVAVADKYLKHTILTSLLRFLPLLPVHRDDLLRRGLSLSEIETGGFKSTPTDEEAAEIARELSQDCDLAGVPGFYKKAGAWSLVKTPSGFFIPVRGRAGLIQGLQIRKDYQRDKADPRYTWLSSRDYPFGSTSGAPCHVQNPERIDETGRCIVIEGALKSFIAAQYLPPSDGGLVALAGVSTFQENFGAHLRKAWPALHTVAIAFDSDFAVKREVKMQLYRLMRSLKLMDGLAVVVRTWTHEKGIDDYLTAEAYEVAEVA